MNDNISDNPLAALQEIKKVMQQSTRVLSLSGWSGIWVGLVAILATSYATTILHTNQVIWNPTNDILLNILASEVLLKNLIILALVTFLVAVSGAIFFTLRKNNKLGAPSNFNAIAQKLIVNLAIPLGAGAVFCYAFATQFTPQYIIPATLVFYGLALINCSKYTFTDIKYLGLFEVILGLIALLLMDFHLLIWGLGFGVLHIVYGIMMWYKYDRK